MMVRILVIVWAVLLGGPIAAQQTFKIDVTGGVREPLPFAAPVFVAETSAANAVANDMTALVRQDLLSTGLFREIPQDAHISVVGNFASLPAFADWQAINAQALVIGSVAVDAAVAREVLSEANARLEELGGQLEAARATDARRQEMQQLVAVADRAQAEVASLEAQVAAAQAARAQANARLLLAEQEWQRSSQLNERGVVSREVLDTRESDLTVARANQASADAAVVSAERAVDAAKAAVQVIETNLEDATLEAPAFGRVLYRLVEPGEIVGAGGHVMTLVDLSNVYLEFFLPARHAHLVPIGAEARITLDVTDVVVPAQIDFVSPVSQFTPRQVETASDRENLMFRVKARVPPELVDTYVDLVKTGVRGVAYVRLASDDMPEWPAFLAQTLAAE